MIKLNNSSDPKREKELMDKIDAYVKKREKESKSPIVQSLDEYTKPLKPFSTPPIFSTSAPIKKELPSLANYVKQYSPSVGNAIEAVDVGTQKMTDAATLGISPLIRKYMTPDIYNQEEKLAQNHPIASGIGQTIGSISPGAMLEKGLIKALPSLYEGLGPITSNILSGTMSAGAQGGLEGLAEGIKDNKGVLGTAKNMYDKATDYATMAGLGTAALGMTGKAIGKYVENKALKNIDNAYAAYKNDLFSNPSVNVPKSFLVPRYNSENRPLMNEPIPRGDISQNKPQDIVGNDITLPTINEPVKPQIKRPVILGQSPQGRFTFKPSQVETIDKGYTIERTPVTANIPKGNNINVGSTAEVPKSKTNEVTIMQEIPDDKLSTIELVQRIKSYGKDAQSSYGLFVKHRNLKPEIDSKEFNKIWNEVSSNAHIETKKVGFNPTHIDSNLNIPVQLTKREDGKVYDILFENGSTGSVPEMYVGKYKPIEQFSQEVPATIQVENDIFGNNIKDNSNSIFKLSNLKSTDLNNDELNILKNIHSNFFEINNYIPNSYILKVLNKDGKKLFDLSDLIDKGYLKTKESRVFYGGKEQMTTDVAFTNKGIKEVDNNLFSFYKKPIIAEYDGLPVKILGVTKDKINGTRYVGDSSSNGKRMIYDKGRIYKLEFTKYSAKKYDYVYEWDLKNSNLPTQYKNNISEVPPSKTIEAPTHPVNAETPSDTTMQYGNKKLIPENQIKNWDSKSVRELSASVDEIIPYSDYTREIADNILFFEIEDGKLIGRAKSKKDGQWRISDALRFKDYYTEQINYLKTYKKLMKLEPSQVKALDYYEKILTKLEKAIPKLKSLKNEMPDQTKMVTPKVDVPVTSAQPQQIKTNILRKVSNKKQYDVPFDKMNLSPKQLSQFEQETLSEIKRIEDEHIKYLKDNSKKGVQVGLMPVWGGDNDKFVRFAQSNNPLWYGQELKKLGKSSLSKKDLEYIAKEQLVNGFDDYTMRVPPDEYYNSLLKRLDEIKDYKKGFVNKNLSDFTPAKRTVEPIRIYNEQMKQAQQPVIESKFSNIKTAKDLPDDIEGLQAYVDEASKRKLQLMDVDLQLFAEAQKRLNSAKLKQRKFIANSVLTARVTPEEMKNFFKENTPEYEPLTNKETWGNAVSKVENDLQSAKNEWDSLDATTTADDTALGQALMFDAIRKGNISEANNIAYDLSEKLTKAGQAVQAASILKRLSPEGMLTYAIRTLQRAEKQLFGKLNGKLKLNDAEAQQIIDRMKKIRNMPEGRQRDIEFAKVRKLVSDKIPPTFREKMKALQRVNLLFNPKTMIRNVMGNVIYSGALTNAKDIVRAGIDKLVSAGMKSKRTAYLPSFTTQAKGLKKGADISYQDYELGIDTSNLPTQFELDTQRVSSPFKNKILRKADELTKLGLRMGDTPFYQAAYDEALRQQMKTHKVNVPTEDMKTFARNVAEERTFQDTNKYVEFFNGFRNALNKIGIKGFGLGDIVLPFTKTPANILKAGVEYSPLNIINVANDAYKLVKNKGPEAQYKFVDSLAKTLTGTGLLGAGMYLASMGIMTGKESKNADAATFKREQGILPYALKLGNEYVSFDWAQPASIPLAMGADMYYHLKDSKSPSESIIKGLEGGTSTLFSQSMIQGLQRLFSTYDDSKLLTQNITNAGYSALLQLMPFNALSRQTAEVFDPYSRTTFDDTGFKAQFANKAINTVPGYRMTLPPKITTMGDVANSRTWYNIFFNPANTGGYAETPAKNEILRLFDQSGETIQFPKISDKEITYKLNSKTEKKQLNGEERARYQELLGKETMKNIQILVNTPKYKKSKDDADKAKMIQGDITDADKAAKKTLLKELGIKTD